METAGFPKLINVQIEYARVVIHVHLRQRRLSDIWRTVQKDQPGHDVTVPAPKQCRARA